MEQVRKLISMFASISVVLLWSALVRIFLHQILVSVYILFLLFSTFYCWLLMLCRNISIDWEIKGKTQKYAFDSAGNCYKIRGCQNDRRGTGVSV